MERRAWPLLDAQFSDFDVADAFMNIKSLRQVRCLRAWGGLRWFVCCVSRVVCLCAGYWVLALACSQSRVVVMLASKMFWRALRFCCYRS